MNIIVPLLALLSCQLIGEALQVLLRLPVPGPVLGMLLLLIGLAVYKSVPKPLADVANGILAHLSLLFVPAGVGVILHISRIEAEWPAIVVALLVSTWLTLIVTVGTMRVCTRLLQPNENGFEDMQ